MTRERSARSAGKLEPADIKNGRYVKPFAELRRLVGGVAAEDPQGYA